MRAISILVVAVTSAMLLTYCKSNKPVKVASNFPATMLPEVKVEYAKMFDKGKILYDINCAKCHNKKVKGKEVYADFTVDDLAKYELRATNSDHLESLTEQTVTEDELVLIKLFLAYKVRTSDVITDVQKDKTTAN